MIRFETLESIGLSVAVMSGCSEGDCRLPADSNNFAGRQERRDFLSVLGLEPEKLVCVRQVHGDAVIRVGVQDAGRGGLDAATAVADCDAMITCEPGLPIGISVADCVPLLVYDPVKGALAAGHAGRLGTMGNIAGRIVEAMSFHFRTDPSDLRAVIGPSAGPDRYEVSEEIALAFEALDLPRNGRLLDLWGANRLQFERAGLPTDQIHVSGRCTIEDAGFYSHRGDGSGARNLAVASL